MPRIDRIRIHNFRGASAPFTLGFAKQKPLVVIFGENGTGKTTIVDALDAVGNGSGGSLTTKSSTTLRTHLPTLGKKPSDMVMEVTSGNTTWTATLGKGGIVTTPTRAADSGVAAHQSSALYRQPTGEAVRRTAALDRRRPGGEVGRGPEARP